MLKRILVQTWLLTAFALGGCAVGPDDNAGAEDGSASAWAAVQAGECVPDCAGRTCGLDPVCGVSCGICRTGQSCDEEVGQCEAACVPDCSGRTCGLDPVCGVSCGSCSQGSSCNADKGVCETSSPPPSHHSCPFGGHRGGGHRPRHRWGF